MGKKEKDIWIGIDEDGNILIPNDRQLPSNNITNYIFNFSELKSNRRDFLKSVGYGTAAFALATACSKSPVKKGMPYFPNSSNSKPGEELWYATTCSVCVAHCPILVKTIDYRPIKIEGNNKSAKTQGGLCASAHASLLDLYNSKRLKQPLKSNIESNWESIDSEIISKLQTINESGKEITIVSQHINSPATLQLLNDFKVQFPKTQVYFTDPLFPESIIQSYKQSFGKAIIPSYKFNKAKLIISFGADFLGSWLSPVEFTNAYLTNRDVDNKRSLSYHVQFESQFSITGASADKRYRIKPSEEGTILSILFYYLKNGKFLQEHKELEEEYHISKIADKLLENKGRSIIISCSNNIATQMLIIGINSLLDNFGRSIDLDNPFITESIGNANINQFISKLKNKHIGALICWNTDIFSDHPVLQNLTDEIESVDLKISFNHFRDKFSEIADYLCPDHHYLEGWNNYLSKGFLQIGQATINPIFNSRQAQESLLKWMSHPSDWYAYLKNSTDQILSVKNQAVSLQFEEVVKRGFCEIPVIKPKRYNFKQYLAPYIKQLESDREKSKGLELVLFESQGLKSYSPHINIFLAEYSDPISTSSWKIYAQISPDTAKKKGIKDGQYIKIKSSNAEIELPCIIQPGVADSCVIIPAGKMAGALVGENNPLQLLGNENSIRSQFNISIQVLPKKEDICRTQVQNIIREDSLVPEMSLRDYLDKKPSRKSQESVNSILSDKRNFQPHHWAMLIDLNKCNGCGSCSISCQVENNIPVVGADETRQGKSMTWLKIHRFYEGEINNPNIRFLPIMCQQCDNAPCESVCPVSAVSSSQEGLNQQNYARCIGARFCATNCPYLSRTFNYKDYTHQNPDSPHMSDKIGRLMLNPEVSVREKGTVEKCTFCVQRIQQAKAKAKQENVSLSDGMIQTACQQSCPASAIYFGDMKDSGSMVYNLSKNKRVHKILDGLGTQPSIYYLSKVRNKDMDI